MINVIKYLIKTASTAVLRPVKLVQRKLKKSFLLKSKVAKLVKTTVKNLISVLSRAPEQKSDYYLIGNKYFAKRLVIVGFVVVILIVSMSQILIIPFVRGRFYTPIVPLTDAILKDYTGKIKLINRKAIVVYDGKMVGGLCEGEGAQYNEEGQLVYKGEFKSDAYDGLGVFYAENQQKIYEGAFISNMFHGKGKLYQVSNEILYEGEFEYGLFNGNGKLYDSDANLMYTGAFSQGFQNGYGVSYYQNGLMEYSGNFLNGRFHGEGTLMSDTGLKIYTGMFANGVFDGNGKLFFESGQIAYEGTFVLGQYSGYGKLYTKEGQLQYEGLFAGGYYSGDGKLYDTQFGFVKYIGTFDHSVFNGVGSYYVFGDEVYNGEWIEGRIPFETYLGLGSFDLREHFLEKGSLIQDLDHYSINLNKIQVKVILSYPEDAIEPAITNIFVTNFELNPMFEKGVNLADVKAKLTTHTVTTENYDGNVYFVVHANMGDYLLNLYFDFTDLTLLLYEYRSL